MIRDLVARSGTAEYIDLRLVSLQSGGGETMVSEGESLLVGLTGSMTASVDGRAIGSIGGRADVFERPGSSLYARAGSEINLFAGDGPSEAVVVQAPPLEGVDEGPTRIIGPDQQIVSVPGRDIWTRTVRTILGPASAASRLIVGETVNVPGGWSSYPPHKHDREAPPDEVLLEEVYFYKLKPSEGFGVQVRYDDLGSHAFLVRDGEMSVISSGYHPVAAAPGYELYYLWAMAGPGRKLAPYFDPAHSWVEASR
ncbi:MAG: 5-deoxy-glucuronate isomerase [Acidimicrobiales bacterium]